MTTSSSAHDLGCSERHTRRQDCDGAAAEARRQAERQRLAPPTPPSPPPPPPEDVRRWSDYDPRAFSPERYRAYARFGGALELIPGIPILICWIGSRPESVKYSDFGPLPALALLPTLGLLFRGGTGFAIGGGLWIARVSLIIAAIIFWGRGYDYGQILSVYDEPWRYRDVRYCCANAWQAAMHLTLGAAVAASVASAYLIGVWRVEDDLRRRESGPQGAGIDPRRL